MCFAAETKGGRALRLMKMGGFLNYRWRGLIVSSVTVSTTLYTHVYMYKWVEYSKSKIKLPKKIILSRKEEKNLLFRKICSILSISIAVFCG